VGLAPPDDAPHALVTRAGVTRVRVSSVAAAAERRAPKKRGAPAHVVTPTQKRLVQHWTAVGLSQAKIASLMGISPDTVQKYYRYELDHGEEIANANVAANLYRIACGPTPAAAGAAQYWLNRRSDKFREGAKRVELTGKNGAPVAVASAQLTLDPRKLSTDQRDALRQILLAASDDAYTPTDDADEDVDIDVDADDAFSDPPDVDGVDHASLGAADWPGDAPGETLGVDDPAGDA